MDEAVSLVYLLSIEYDGKARKAKLRLLDTSTQRLIEIYDWTGHKPYLLTDLSPEELVENSALISSRGFDHIEVVEKFNPLTHEKVLMSKVVARDPLSVGGTRNSMRDILAGHAWEAHIKYNHNYIFDTALIPGMMYRLENNKLELVDVEVPKNVVETLAEIYNYDEKIVSEAVEWAKLLQAPIPPIKRLAIDIEVYTEGEHVPSPQDPRGEVIAVSMAGSDGFMKIFILRRPNKGEEIPSFKSVDGEYEVEIEYFDSEKELLEATMKMLDSYPLILTFNGDNFDLPYLRERARRLGIPEENIPIIPRPRDRMVTLRNAIHIDLYRFFNNRSMQVYAFGNKYRDVKTLDEIAKALLGIGKIYLEKRISELNYKELAEYCFNDAYLTLKLTQFSGDLVI
ncbi:MAG: ribonuclease H-like domain-containing protein, partial [Thermoproteales archaeon]|nr:ribonuclease H-like domain-containing protein [Thermoproteales archaeon]